jgi:hypothetical protein
MENTLNGEKSIKIEHISEIMKRPKKKLKSSLSILYRLDTAKKPSHHATVPLSKKILLRHIVR